MADPITAGLAFASKVAPIVSLAGTAISFLGAGKEADADEQAALINLEGARLRSEAARFQTGQDLINIKRAAFKQIGAVRAAASASGVTISGSVLDVIEESAYLANIDIQRREIRGKFEELGISIEKSLFASEAEQAAKSKPFNQAAAILTGLGDLATLG